MAVAVNFALLVIILTNTKRSSFASANSVCYSLNGEYVQGVQSSRISTSIWTYIQQTKLSVGHRPHGALTILLLLCGDV